MENESKQDMNNHHDFPEGESITSVSPKTDKNTPESPLYNLYKRDSHVSHPSFSSDQLIDRKIILGYASTIGGTLAMVTAGVDASLPTPVALGSFLAGLGVTVLGTIIAGNE